MLKWLELRGDTVRNRTQQPYQFVRRSGQGNLRSSGGPAHKIAALGGTFDVLHRGHKRLITKAFEIADTVLIGLTGDSLVSRLHKNHRVRSYSYRYRVLRSFLKSAGLLSRAKIVELKEPFGPAARRKRLEALVVSEQTRRSGTKLNALRRGRGLPPARLYVVRLVKAADGFPITSTRIRRREIDPEGKLIRRSGADLRVKSRRRSS